jgi:bacterioferritin (cytochrome b1)
MIESLISAAVAVITGGAVLTSRIHNRILELDKRIDQVELGMAQSYVSKADFERTLERVETHMLRIEDKLDDLVKVSSANK